MRKFIYGLLALVIAATGMAYADSIITGSKPFTFIPGTTISSSQVNANFDYIINQVNTNAAKNGANSSITSLLGLTTPIAPAQGGSSVYLATSVGGTANAITISATVPAISGYTLGNRNLIVFTPTAANTASTTININGTGVGSIRKPSSGGLINLLGGELQNGVPVLLGWNSTDFYTLIGPAPLIPGTATSLASAGTTDLGTIGSHNVSITGTTTITSFGSSANVAEPLYYVKFTGSLSITFNATSMITPGGGNMFISAADALWVEYLGSGNWRIVNFMPSSPVYTGGLANGLTITNNAGTPTTQIDITTTGISVLENVSTFANDTIGPLSKTINAATTGVNALDTGSLANNTWYHVYLISDGGANSGTLLSASATAPTMPSTYTFKYRVGAVRTGGAATFLRTIQKGNTTSYQVVAGSTTPNMPIVVTGVTGSVTVPTYTTFSMANFVPPTAIKVRGGALSVAGIAIGAPNAAYGPHSTLTNPPPLYVNTSMNAWFEFVLETQNIFYAANNASTVLWVAGWVDAVNAN